MTHAGKWLSEFLDLKDSLHKCYFEGHHEKGYAPKLQEKNLNIKTISHTISLGNNYSEEIEFRHQKGLEMIPLDFALYSPLERHTCPVRNRARGNACSEVPPSAESVIRGLYGD
ncbi:hypothetical protein YC2023_002789 [Brassica napus]